MPPEPHDPAEELLPWYATGQLDSADRALVEAHLASCARCQRELAGERGLIEHYRILAPELDSGWARLRARIEAQPRRPRRRALSDAFAEFWDMLKRPAVAALATAQFAFVAVGAAVLQWASQPAYVALGSAQKAPSANVIVMFRPEAREADLRGALQASGGSLVGGPTDADAYLLNVPIASRSLALSKLRSNSSVTLAQPIDGPSE